MKKEFSFLVMILLSGFLHAQLRNECGSVYKVDPPVPGEAVLLIPVNFDESNLQKGIPDSLKNVTVTRVDLVYTTYSLNPDFDQRKLNLQRTKNLQTTWPATRGEWVNWKSVGQTSASSAEEAKNLFHGFVIYYRVTPTAESVEAELDFIDKFLFDPDSYSAPAVAGTSEDGKILVETKPVKEEKSTTRDAVEYDTPVFSVSEEGRVISGWHGGCIEWRNIAGKGSEQRISVLIDSVQKIPDFTTYYITKSDIKGSTQKSYNITWGIELDSCDTGILTGMAWMRGADYDIVSTVFSRFPDWEKSLVVLDVTGSMSPYIAQTMAWIKDKDNSEQVHAFVFFNDGNNAADKSKVVGKVGGIYFQANSEFNAVYGSMKKAMQSGFGGDCPENNVEATLAGIEQYPDVKEIVMVADNWATPRDLSLVSKLGRPVHVILCGATGGVNLAYIQLAYDTGGSVHTMEDDLDARGIKPGKTIQIGNSYFTVVNGKIVKASNG